MEKERKKRLFELLEKKAKEIGVEDHWYYGRFVDSIKHYDKDAVLEIVERFEKIDGNETEEELEDLLNDIESLEGIIPNDIYQDLKKKYRIHEKRIDRSVSDSFGEILHNIRKEKGLTLKELEERTGISASYIHRIEKGERKAPSLSIITKLADALKVSVGRLITATEGNKKEEKQQSTEIVPIQELLTSSNYKIDEKIFSDDAKKALVDLIEQIYRTPLKDTLKEMVVIAEKVDTLKKYL